MCWLHCLLTDDNESCEVNCDSMFGIYRAPYEKPTPLCCIEPLYKLNDDGSVPGYPDMSASMDILLNKEKIVCCKTCRVVDTVICSNHVMAESFVTFFE